MVLMHAYLKNDVYVPCLYLKEVLHSINFSIPLHHSELMKPSFAPTVGPFMAQEIDVPNISSESEDDILDELAI